MENSWDFEFSPALSGMIFDLGAAYERYLCILGHLRAGRGDDNAPLLCMCGQNVSDGVQG